MPTRRAHRLHSSGKGIPLSQTIFQDTPYEPQQVRTEKHLTSRTPTRFIMRHNRQPSIQALVFLLGFLASGLLVAGPGKRSERKGPEPPNEISLLRWLEGKSMLFQARQ